MKKYITPIIALALVLVSLFYSASNSIGINFGKGNGTDKEIKTKEEFIAFCDYISSNFQEAESNDDFAPYMEDLFPGGSNVVAPYAITSFTYHEKTVANSGGTSQSDSSSSSSNMKLNRTLDIYFAKDVTLYHSVGWINRNSQSSHEDESMKSGSYADFEVYIYIKGLNVAVFIEKFDIYGVEDAPDFSPAYGKWLNAAGGEDIFTSVNDNNISLLGRLSTSLKNEQNFKKSNKEYTIKEGKFAECLGYIVNTSLPKELDGSFKLDLGDSTQPKIDIQYDYSDSISQTLPNGSSYSASSKAYQSINIRIESINNTFVDKIDFENMGLLVEVMED